MLLDGFIQFLHADSMSTVGSLFEVHGIQFASLIFFSPDTGPFMRMCYQLILQAHVIAHPEGLAICKIVEEEIGLAWFQHGALMGATPIQKYLRRVDKRHLDRESAQLVHLGKGIIFLNFNCVKYTDFELFAFLPRLLGHILQPSDDGNAVASFVAVVYKSLASVF